MVCESDGMQACGKPDLSLPGLALLCFHGLGRAEPAPLDLMPPNSHLPTDIVVGTTTVLLPVIVWV